MRRGDAEGAGRVAADHVWLTGARHGFDAGAEPVTRPCGKR
jgi:hypothetical protein